MSSYGYPLVLALLLVGSYVCSHFPTYYEFSQLALSSPCLGKGTTAFAPQPIEPAIYHNLYTYAHLIDIAYCIDTFHQIEKPFDCGLCSQFSNMSLIYQWYFEDAVCGYIAKTHGNLFNYNDTALNEKLTLVVSLRGTRSLSDTVADLRVGMTSYRHRGSRLPQCGEKCRVHRGFDDYFRRNLASIQKHITEELDAAAGKYELIFVGHSMGGSVALLLALHFLDMGYDKVTLVTMGQPLVGNAAFTTWADFVLGSQFPAVHNTYDRKFLRVIHKGDIVPTLPHTSNTLEHYAKFGNQIYINTTAENTDPKYEDVVDCYSDQNGDCIAGDFGLFFPKERDLYHTHNTYFRKLGLCGLHI